MTTTPFRYPGAKNKLLPVIMEHLTPPLNKQPYFTDLFVGGGSVLLEVARQYPKLWLHANDKDYWMYCFWKIVSEDSNRFASLLDKVKAQPTLELFYKLREEKTEDEIECAYRAIFFNRTTFSGILSSGPIGGKEQKSKYAVDCRYNAIKLQIKILNCRDLLLGRTVVTNDSFFDCEALIDDHCIYADPPYYLKGDMLYPERMNHKDHETLSLLLQKRNNWVLSYDDCPEVREFYKDCKIIDLAARYCINGKKENWENKNELIILPGTK